MLLSSSLHIDICSISVLYISVCFDCFHMLTSLLFKLCVLLSFSRFYTLRSVVFQFCILYFAFLVSTYQLLHYFSSVYFTLLSSSVHISICSIIVLCILLFFLPQLILTSAVVQFCMFYFVFFVCAYCHLQCFTSAYFTFL